MDQIRVSAFGRVELVGFGSNILVVEAKPGYSPFGGSAAMSADGVQTARDGLASSVGPVADANAACRFHRDQPDGYDRCKTLAPIAIAGLMAINVIELIQRAMPHLKTGMQPEVFAALFVVLFETMPVNAGATGGSGRRQSGS